MLDENRDEALERTAHCTMNHHGLMLGVVFADVFQGKTLGRVVVELNRAELPRSPNCSSCNPYASRTTAARRPAT